MRGRKLKQSWDLSILQRDPSPNVAISPILGGQWIKTPSSKFKYEFVLTENANDRNVPIEAKLLPYNQ